MAPSDLSSTTLQQVVTGQAVNPVGELANVTLSGSTFAAYSPYAAVYEALDGSNNTQLYGLALADSNDSNPPTPVQIGLLSLSPATTSACYGQSHAGYTNLLEPTTAFFVIQYALTAGSCNIPTTVLMNWTDSSSTAPTPVSAITANTPGSNYADLYIFPTGQLYAEVLSTVGGNLNIYPAGAGGTPNFSSPRTPPVATFVENVEQHPIYLNRSGQASSTVLFSNVLSGGKYALYRIDTAGHAAKVYSATGTLEMTPTVTDNTYIYFVDVVTTAGFPPIYYYFFKEPIDGSTLPVQIGTAEEPQSGTTGTIFPYGTFFSLLDADGSNLILFSDNLTTSPLTFALYTLSVTGTSTQAPSLLWQYNTTGANYLVAFLDYGSDYLFVNEISSVTNTDSLVLAPSSPQNQTPVLGRMASSAFTPWAQAIPGFPTNDTVLQFEGLTSAGTESGGTLYTLSTSNIVAAPTPVTLTPPTSSSPFADVVIAPVSNTIGTGTSGSNPSVGLAVDISKNQINTISVPSTNVSPF